jgi:hypothetical protein
MTTWLFKEEPTHCGFDQLGKDQRTTCSGVKNALAQKHLRSVKNGDRFAHVQLASLFRERGWPKVLPCATFGYFEYSTVTTNFPLS